MQNVGASLLAILQSRERDLVDLYELYAPSVTSLTPANATKLFCQTAVVWNGNTYEQQAITRGDVSRYMDGRFNSVTITFSNVDRSVGQFLAGLSSLEGYRLLIRTISRQVDNDSLVLFVGRCEKAFEVDNDTTQITAKQDLGSIENDLPWRIFSEKCQVAGGFKGVECLAGESLGSKSGAYQAASTCDFSHGQCSDYANLGGFQGQRFRGATGNFKLSQRRGGAGGAFLGLLGLGNKRVTKQWSSQADTPYGKPIPIGYGRTQIELTAIQHADTGEYIAGQSAIGEGELTAIENIRNVTPGFASTFQAQASHLGKYGTDSSQNPAGFFASAGDKHSHLAYFEYTIKGENPDTGEPAPTMVAVALWRKIAVWNGSAFTGAAWTDNPVNILRDLLTEPRSLNYNSAWIDDAVCGQTAEYCDAPLKDNSKGEQLYLSNTAGTGGTDFKRYRSTGLIDTFYFRFLLGLDSTHYVQRETTYNTFNPASPPSSIAAITQYRKRYTCNFHITEKIKAADFIFKKLLPSFRGYLITSSAGKLQIKSERDQLTQFLRSNVSAGVTALPIEDAAAWKALSLPVLYALIGVGLSTSETARVGSVDYSTAGNSVTLSTSVSGTITATASGATLTGGSTTVQASGTVTIGGTITAGNSATVTIDGVANTYTINANDTTGTVAAMLAATINANASINRYIKAEWSTGSPTVVTIKSKLGTLNLAAGVASAHNQAEEIMHIHQPFAHAAWGALSRGNVLRNSFKWPLGNRQSSYNQFVIIYNEAIQDFQETELRENDYGHQATINKVNKLEVDGTCVDNYHQADRLVRAARFKYREGDFFCSWSSAGQALLLEEGDVVCAQHDSMPLKRNLPLRLEEVKVTADHRVNLTGRLYNRNQFIDDANPKTVSLVTGIGWLTNAPGAVASLTLTQPVNGTVRGTFTFASFPGGQTAKIEVKKAGAGSFIDTGQRIKPDGSGAGSFEVSGLPSGSTEFRVTPVSDTGKEGSATTASITVNNPAALPGTYTCIAVGALTSTWTVGSFVASQALAITRVKVDCKTGPSGCGTNAVIRVSNGTFNRDVTIDAQNKDTGAITENVTAAQTVTISVQTAASGCATPPADATITVQYTLV